MNIEEKLQLLREETRTAGQIILAFSGGVDSTLLAYLGQEELGGSFQAITVDNGLQSKYDLANACQIAACLGIRHKIVKVDSLQHEEVRGNTPRRCYFCKKILLENLLMLAAQEGCQVWEGSHAEDYKQYRPGQQALLELGIISPLQIVGLNKKEIRQLARELGMPNWNASASPCLATRFPYGENLTPAILGRVEGAEEIIRKAGFHQFRVRAHGDLARIEVGAAERERFFDTNFMDDIEQALRGLGFIHVSLDLCGYRMGSMDMGIR
ncbi:atp-utilizing enzyme of the pp-loop superfamily [hydrocarbon metagenome]|uniref:Atp-utilizing enzyme of the pp-loop superfamily n=1 Tax=hydrocarbon metagenome TaxID=938273 RepID=A0A0W8E3V1_9ZZZZ